jgi:hypothetical protein
MAIFAPDDADPAEAAGALPSGAGALAEAAAEPEVSLHAARVTAARAEEVRAAAASAAAVTTAGAAWMAARSAARSAAARV